jgi:hypothetical protein
MYIYNVTIKITPAIELEWIDWMKNEHMDEVIATGAFDRYSFYKLIDPISEDDDGITYIAQYFTDSKERYELYINQHAPLLREKGYARFGNQFIAFRTVMKSMD